MSRINPWSVRINNARTAPCHWTLRLDGWLKTAEIEVFGDLSEYLGDEVQVEVMDYPGGSYMEGRGRITEVRGVLDEHDVVSRIASVGEWNIVAARTGNGGERG